MRAADDAVLHSSFVCASGKVQSAVKLVTLYANQRKYRFATLLLSQSRKVTQIGLHILIEGRNFTPHPLHVWRGKAFHVSQGAVGHESPAEPLYETVDTILGRFNE